MPCSWDNIDKYSLQMQQTLAPIADALLNSNGWKKYLDPPVGRGTVAWPKQSVDQERYGIHYCYDGEILLDGIICHKYHISQTIVTLNIEYPALEPSSS